MIYSYNSPIEAIVSLETAYTEKSLEAVLASKDFKAEAFLILQQSDYNYDVLDQKLIEETIKLLELSLIKSLNENGFPSFHNVRREFSDLEQINDNLYSIEERLFYPNNELYSNKIFLSCKDSVWKVAMIEE